jgi:ketosteroid isomerase-like protein
MKRYLLLILAGLAIGFALPTFAQQTNTPDPQLRDAFVALNKKFDEGFVNGDVAGLAAFYTEDAVIVPNDGPPIYGREAIVKRFTDMVKHVKFSKHISKLEQYSPHIMGTAGNEVWTTGEFTQTFQVDNGKPLQISGHFLNIAVLEGDAWKTKVDTYNYSAPPIPAETK